MATTITNARLDADCRQIVNKAMDYGSGVGACVSVMFRTGCREGEVLDRARWIDNGDLTWTLKPQKHNGHRIILESDLPEVFRLWAVGSGLPSALSSRNNLRRICRTFSLYPDLMCGGKGISSHRFRHNRIRDLFARGYSAADIRDLYGLTSLAVVNGYGSAALYY